MLNHLTDLIQEVGGKEAQKQGIPADMMSKITGETKDNIVSGFKDTVSSGNISQITDLFSGKSNASSNPMVNMITKNLGDNLMSKFGLEGSKANGFASAIIPTIMNLLVSKSKNKSSSGFNITDVISSLGGDTDTSGILGQLGGMLGGNSGKKSDAGGIFGAVKGMLGGKK